MSVARSIGAVAAGFFATAILSVGTDAIMHGAGVFPPVTERMSDAMFLVPAVYRALYTVAGGWITGRLAPSRPMLHGWVLAGFGLLGGLGGLSVALAHPELGPLWYSLSIPLSAIPCIGLGAKLGSSGR